MFRLPLHEPQLHIVKLQPPAVLHPRHLRVAVFGRFDKYFSTPRGKYKNVIQQCNYGFVGFNILEERSTLLFPTVIYTHTYVYIAFYFHAFPFFGKEPF